MHDRHALGSRVVDQHVDLVSVEVAGELDALTADLHLLALLAKGIDVVDHVQPHCLEVRYNLRQGGILVLQCLDELGHGDPRDFLVQRLELLAHFLLPQRNLANRVAQLRAQFIDQLLDLVLFLFRERRKLLGPHHLALAHRRERVAGGGAQDGDVALLRLLVEM